MGETLRWTRERPQAVGWYWFRWDRLPRDPTRAVDKVATIVHVHMERKSWNPDDGEVLSCNIGDVNGPAKADYPSAEWYGPLRPPAENARG